MSGISFYLADVIHNSHECLQASQQSNQSQQIRHLIETQEGLHQEMESQKQQIATAAAASQGLAAVQHAEYLLLAKQVAELVAGMQKQQEEIDALKAELELSKQDQKKAERTIEVLTNKLTEAEKTVQERKQNCQVLEGHIQELQGMPCFLIHRLKIQIQEIYEQAKQAIKSEEDTYRYHRGQRKYLIRICRASEKERMDTVYCKGVHAHFELSKKAHESCCVFLENQQKVADEEVDRLFKKALEAETPASMQESCSSFKRSIDSLLWQKKVDWNYFEGNNQGTDALQQISIYEQLIQGNEEKIKKSFLRHTPLKEIKQEIENQKAIIKQFQQNLRQNYLSLSYPQPDWYMPNIGWEVSRAECNIYDIFKRCFL